MQILLWLVPPVLVTVVAMIWVSVVGHARARDEQLLGHALDASHERARERSRQRMGEALARDLPSPEKPHARGQARGQAGERSTGVAVRPSRRSA